MAHDERWMAQGDVVEEVKPRPVKAEVRDLEEHVPVEVSEAASVSVQPVTILMVDDQPENLLSLEAVLEGLGQKLVSVSSGREALKYLLNHDCAVILLDVMMPEMDGFETATLIRQRQRSSTTPIIFVTAAYTSEAHMFQGYATGAVDYIFKPVIPEILRSKVRVFVELAQQTALIRRQAAELQALADARAELLEDLRRKNLTLNAINTELESFSYSVAHDLKEPLRSMNLFIGALRDDCADKLEPFGKDYLQRMANETRRMTQLIEDLLNMARRTRGKVRKEPVDLSEMAEAVARELRRLQPGRKVEIRVEPSLLADADGRLVRMVLDNLMGNAWKFTARQPEAVIEVGVVEQGGERVFYVKDNGVGFEAGQADRLFMAFQRLHADADFPGTGIGLATVKRVVHRHGGRVWAVGAPGEGATFYFTL